MKTYRFVAGTYDECENVYALVISIGDYVGEREYSYQHKRSRLCLRLWEGMHMLRPCEKGAQPRDIYI